MSKFSKNQTEGELLYHTACIGDNCNSSDAMAVYKLAYFINWVRIKCQH